MFPKWKDRAESGRHDRVKCSQRGRQTRSSALLTPPNNRTMIFEVLTEINSLLCRGRYHAFEDGGLVEETSKQRQGLQDINTVDSRAGTGVRWEIMREYNEKLLIVLITDNNRSQWAK